MPPLLTHTTIVHHQLQAGPCVADTFAAPATAGTGTLTCASNSVDPSGSTAAAVLTVANSVQACFPGDTIAVAFTFLVDFNSNEMNDFAWYVATDGGDAQVAGGTCASSSLRGSPSSFDIDGGTVGNEDGDTCLDVDKDNGRGDAILTLTPTVQVACADSVSVCFTWKNNGQNTQCESTGTITPGPSPGSMCRCVDIPIDDVVSKASLLFTICWALIRSQRTEL